MSIEVPRSIQFKPVDTTKPVTEAQKTNGEVAPKKDDAAVADKNFAEGLKSDLTTNVEKGSVPSNGVSFDAPKEEVKPAVEPKAITNQVSSFFDGKPALSFKLEEPKLPELQTSEWKGYNSEVNSSVTTAFDEKSTKKVPVISQNKISALLKAMGAGKVEDLQNTIGAKKDNQFGPETYFKTKNHISGQINQVKTADDMGKISQMLGLMGKDPQVEQMKTVLNERVRLNQEYTSTKEGLNNYFNDVNGILAGTNPKEMKSLEESLGKLDDSFKKLPDNLKNNDQAVNANKEATGRVKEAISTLKGELETSKQGCISEINCLADEASKNALISGDKSKLDEGKQKINALDNTFPQVKDNPEVVDTKNKAITKLDETGAKIDQINALKGKTDWSPEDAKLAKDLHNSLPDGAFKNDLGKSIDSHKVRETNKSNLPTTKEALHDVIGNGFWNLENKEGTKSIFQLLAKQGLLNEAMSKINAKDQAEAMNILTKDVDFKKPSDADKFNVDIAKTMYQRISSVTDISKDVKNSGELAKPVSGKMEDHKIDTKTYTQGLKFSIGSDRIGSEREAALTMIRGVMNGEAPKEVLPSLSRYEVQDVSRYLEKNGKQGEKDQFLGTISQYYNSGQAVNIDSLSKGDKAKVIKNILDTNQESAKVAELLKKSGKSVVIETVKSQNLSDSQLVTISKNINAGELVNDSGAAAKVLSAMIRSYNKQDGSVKLDDIKKFIDQTSKSDWDAENNVKMMKSVVSGLGDGKDSEYAKFQYLSPATLDRMRDIARSNPYQNNNNNW